MNEYCSNGSVGKQFLFVEETKLAFQNLNCDQDFDPDFLTWCLTQKQPKKKITEQKNWVMKIMTAIERKRWSQASWSSMNT